MLVKGRIPKVLGLAECLREWLDHLRDVLVRRSNFRKSQIEHRLEVLGGYLIAYLNIDKVIKIIRTEDEPKPALIKAFKLTEVQADAILNMRLRSLRKLEEMEIRTEDKDLRKRTEGHQGHARLGSRAVGEGRRAGQEGARHLWAEDAARQAPHAPSPTRPSTISPRSRRPLSSASRSRSWFPRRAGCAR